MLHLLSIYNQIFLDWTLNLSQIHLQKTLNAIIRSMKSPENIFFTNKNYTLYHVLESNILIVESQGVIRLDLAKAGWLAALDKAEEHKITKWISDGSAVELISTDANEWWANEWFPLAGQRLRFPGKRLTATVLSPRFYAEVTTKHAVNNTLEYEAVVGEQNKHLEHLYFREFTQAYHWISTYQSS